MFTKGFWKPDYTPNEKRFRSSFADACFQGEVKGTELDFAQKNYARANHERGFTQANQSKRKVFAYAFEHEQHKL